MSYILYIGDMMDTTIRNIDERIYRQLKAKAAMDGISVGKAITQAIKVWLNEERGEKKASLLDIKPESFGKKNLRLSEEMDEILYVKPHR
ncbi:MAG: hypothetical protein AB1779_10915 [Candidatus Thermoplasmatota archaeon]